MHHALFHILVFPAVALHVINLNQDPICPGSAEVPVFVLNLDRRRDRLNGFQEMLGKTAPKMCDRTCRVRAPDGRSWGADVDKSIIASTFWNDATMMDNLRKPTLGWINSKGGVGCVAGHALVWEHILQMKSPWAIVFEDDVGQIRPDATKFVCELAETRKNTSWDFVLLNTFNPEKTNLKQALQLERNSDDWAAHRYGAQAYAISQKGAKDLLIGLFPLRDHRQFDGTKTFLWNQNFSFVANPGIAKQKGGVGFESSDAQIYLEGKRAPRRKQGCSFVDCPAIDKKQMVIPALANPGGDSSNMLFEFDSKGGAFEREAEAARESATVGHTVTSGGGSAVDGGYRQ